MFSFKRLSAAAASMSRVLPPDVNKSTNEAGAHATTLARHSHWLLSAHLIVDSNTHAHLDAHHICPSLVSGRENTTYPAVCTTKHTLISIYYASIAYYNNNNTRHDGICHRAAQGTCRDDLII